MWYYSAAHWHLGDVMMDNITFLWFLLCLCESLHVAVKMYINYSLLHLLLLQIDLSEAFDRQPWEAFSWSKQLFHYQLQQSNGWMVLLLPQGHQSCTLFRNCLSSCRNIHTGVPQGAVTSPKLFNFYLHHLPPPPAGVDTVMYADDQSTYEVGSEIQILCDRFNTYVPKSLQFFKEWNLIVKCFSREIHSYFIHPSTKTSSRAFTDVHKLYNRPSGKTAKNSLSHPWHHVWLHSSLLTRGQSSCSW